MALSFEAAEELIYEFCKTYPQARTITYNLAQTQEEIYGPENTVELRGRISGSYRAASRGADFALANSDSNEKFERTLRHEILGHFGINTFKPDEKRAVLNAIIEARSEVGLETLWGYVDRLYPGQSDMRNAEEVYALACEAIEPSDRSAAIDGQKSYDDVCVSRTRPMRISDLINLTTMVAEGLHDSTRSQQTFPESDSAQFKQDTPMKTSEYPVWLAVQPDERNKMHTAAGQLSDGRSAVEWDKEEKLWFARPGCDLDRVQEWMPDRSMRAGGGDPEAEFLDVLTQAGLVVKGMPVMNGTRQRVATTDDKGGKNSGVYCGYLDRRPGGWFINYHRADSAKDVTNWSASGGEADPVARLHIRAAAKQSQEDSARQRTANYERQTRIATRLYDRLPAADPAHPYLVRKGIPPTPEIRQTRNGALVVPFFSAEGNFKSLQYIPASGDKRLFKGAPKKGNFLVVGGPLEPGQLILYAEGYATARSVNLATDRPVVMTIDAYNMATVAQILHQQLPGSEHLFLADFDHAKPENVGVVMATLAADEVGGHVIHPVFNESEIAQGFTDFNDLHQSRGLDGLRETIAELFPNAARPENAQTAPDPQAIERLGLEDLPMSPSESGAAMVLKAVREPSFEPELLGVADRDFAELVSESVSGLTVDGPGTVVAIPLTWTGRLQTDAWVVDSDMLQPAGDRIPDFFSVHAENDQGQFVWIADCETKDQANELSQRLQLIDAYGQRDEHDIEAKLAAINFPTAPLDGQVPFPVSSESVHTSTDTNNLQPSLDPDAVRDRAGPENIIHDEVTTVPDSTNAATSGVFLIPDIRTDQPAPAAEAVNPSREAAPASVADSAPAAVEPASSINTDVQPASANAEGPGTPEPAAAVYALADNVAKGPTTTVEAPFADLTADSVASIDNQQKQGDDLSDPPEFIVRTVTSQPVVRESEPQLESTPNQHGKPIEPAIAPDGATPTMSTLQFGSAESAPSAGVAQDAKGFTPEQLQWARSQSWFEGSGQDEDGTYVSARELRGNQVQWLFRDSEELTTWAEKQRPYQPKAAVTSASSSSPTAGTVQPEVQSNGIDVGPRIGKDEPPLQPSQIDKDNLLTRITNEPQGDNSVLYKLDNEPAFVDRGSRLEMVPGAGQSDEKILAALLTAARFYRGQIELTGSDAFKAKAIELIAQNQVNVSMKNPAQQLMLDQARQALDLPVVKPDAIHGNTPEPFDRAPPATPVMQVATAAGSMAPTSPAVPEHQAAPMPVNAAANNAYVPLAASDPISFNPSAAQAGPVDDAPPLGAARQTSETKQAGVSGDQATGTGVDPAIHQLSTSAAQGVTGKVMSCGKAPFRFDPQNSESVHIKLRTKTGVQTFWGMELAGLLRETRIEPGRMATLQYLGEKPVTVRAPVKDPDTGAVLRYEDKQAKRNQWSLGLLNGTAVRTGDDQGVKLVAYDAARFDMIQHSIMTQLAVQIDAPPRPADGLFWMTPNGQGSAKAGDPLSAPRPAVDTVDVGKPVISSWSPDGQLDMALFRGDGPYLQGVVRQGDQYQHVLVSLPGHAEAPPMVINQITDQGLVPIGVGNGINRSGGEPVAREHIAFKLDGDPAVRVGKLDFPAEVPPALHVRLGFDERWKDTSTLPKSSPAAAPTAQPNMARPA